MTMKEFLQLVQILSTICYVKWFNWNDGNKWELALSCIDSNGEPIEINEQTFGLPKHKKLNKEGMIYYVFKHLPK